MIRNKHKGVYKTHKRPILVETLTVYIATFAVVLFDLYLTILIKCAEETLEQPSATIYDGLGFCSSLLSYAK